MPPLEPTLPLLCFNQLFGGFLGFEMEEDRMMKWFAYEHLPEHLRVVSIKFYEVACSLCALVDAGPERTVALRKLLEAKDAAVRAKLNPGG
jgi:hypothetical protein